MSGVLHKNDSPKNVGGRPSKYDPSFLEKVKVACRLGGTDDDLAKMLGVSVDTINRWRVSNSEFADALQAEIGRAHV